MGHEADDLLADRVCVKAAFRSPSCRGVYSNAGTLPPDGVYIPTQARSRYHRHAADTKLMLRLRLAFVKCRRPMSTCLWNIHPCESMCVCLWDILPCKLMCVCLWDILPCKLMRVCLRDIHPCKLMCACLWDILPCKLMCACLWDMHSIQKRSCHK